MKELISKDLFGIAKKMNSSIYIVGGAVRNFVMGLEQNATDIDICGTFDAELLRGEENIRLSSINKKLGTCQIQTKNGIYEYTRFRKEKYEGGAHEPSKVEFHDSIETDALRRDFTCNSIYYDVLNDKIIDILDGIDDIKNKLIRTSCDKIFESDGLRIMRAVRFAAQLGFSLEENSAKMLKEQACLLGDISPERKRDELEKILHADKKYGVNDAHYRGLKLMQEYNIFPYIIPEIKALEGVKQNPKYHIYDVMEHTFLAVKNARDDVRLAALMHDTGKPDCLDSEGHMKGHNVVSEKIARLALGQGRLNYPKKIIEETARLCYLHMYDLKGETSDSKMKFFVAENFDIIDKIAALRDADGKATGMNANHKFNRFLYFKDILIAENAPLAVKDLKIKGDIMETLCIPNVKRGAILKELLNLCILSPKLNNTEWLTNQIEKAAKEYEG